MPDDENGDKKYEYIKVEPEAKVEFDVACARLRKKKQDMATVAVRFWIGAGAPIETPEDLMEEVQQLVAEHKQMPPPPSQRRSKKGSRRV